MSASRKASWEYSKNKNTIRARARNSRLSEYQRTVEQAKAADSKAVTRAWKARTDTETFKMANENKRNFILGDVEKDVMDRRRRQKIDANSKIARFMERYAVPPPQQGQQRAPIAIMAPPGFSSFAQPSSESPRSTPGPALPYVLPSIEGAASEPPYGHISYQQPLPSIPELQRDQAASGMPFVNLKNELNVTRGQVEDLKRQVDALNNDLTVTKSSVIAQEARMERLDRRLNRFEEQRAARRQVTGMQALADAAGKVAEDLSGGISA
ncbi:Uu.00g107510.m01.CDS01 [Anthostomella pinea]|uniref:Uu.00g107510.m01.CDS01 n=1 Tax=Anthostomella pinea TaxID=933095 RepID=A0AAI8YFZ6_9PEZI|nr:Uu.00g107510.m01.CDS01 [Anthostomella pinea]